MSISPLIDREAWLAERRKGIGASEAAAALGVSPWASPRKLWLEKMGRRVTEENEAMLWGNLLEPVVLREYARRTGEQIMGEQVFMWGDSPDVPLFCTLDATTQSGRIVEVKTVSARGGEHLDVENDDAEELGADIPAHWQLQAQQQMLITGASVVDFAILIGGQKLIITPAEFRPEMAECMLPGLARFWRHVERREMPPETHEADASIMHEIYPGCSGEIVLHAGDCQLVDSYEEFGAALATGKKLRKEFKALILERMGNHAIGYLPDGRIVTRKLRTVEEACITRKGYTFPDLRIRKAQ